MKSIRVFSEEEKIVEQFMIAINKKDVKRLAKLLELDEVEDIDYLNHIINKFGTIKSYEISRQGEGLCEFEFRGFLIASEVCAEVVIELAVGEDCCWRLGDILVDRTNSQTGKNEKQSLLSWESEEVVNVCDNNSIGGN